MATWFKVGLWIHKLQQCRDSLSFAMNPESQTANRVNEDHLVQKKGVVEKSN